MASRPIPDGSMREELPEAEKSNANEGLWLLLQWWGVTRICVHCPTGGSMPMMLIRTQSRAISGNVSKKARDWMERGKRESLQPVVCFLARERVILAAAFHRNLSVSSNEQPFVSEAVRLLCTMTLQGAKANQRRRIEARIDDLILYMSSSE